MSEPRTTPANTVKTKENRYFPRIKYRAYADLIIRNDHYEVHVLDLSFNGALVALIGPHNLKINDALTLVIDDNKDDSKQHVITMRGTLAHQKDHFLGLECQADGIDNQTQLHELLKRHENTEKNQRPLTTMMAEYEQQQ